MKQYPHINIQTIVHEDDQVDRLEANLVMAEGIPPKGKTWESDELYTLEWTATIDELERTEAEAFIERWKANAAKLKLPFIMDEDLLAECFEDE